MRSQLREYAIVASLLIASCGAGETAVAPPLPQDFNELRQAMVETQIRARDVSHDGVLKAMRDVPRHEFVPEAYRSSAYDDTPLPIGLDQTISQPYIVALMSELAEPQADDRVLEVGTGSGYQAAVISRLVSRVYSIELSEHARAAAERLQRLGFANVEVRAGNGYLGWPEEAPFDIILVTAGATEIPPALIEQLKPGGRMVIPVGSGPVDQVLKVITKQASGEIETRDVIPVRFVPLRRQ
jgi:protein-L-isoaspartate(D-aspartate) O-methyltransferase